MATVEVDGREQEGQAGGGGEDVSGKVASTRVHFPDTHVGDVSVVKVALCNRSRKDAVIKIETDAAHDSSFRLRHRQVAMYSVLCSFSSLSRSFLSTCLA